MSKTGGYTGPLEQVGPCQWRIPRSYRADMRVDGLIFADEKLIEQIKKDQGPEQVVNVATLPGIQKASLAMPDIHWGYGFAIGGVAATDPEEGGVISPGGVGYDINCGVRLLRDEPRLGRGQARDPAARRSALPRHPDRRRPDRPLPVRQAQAEAADGARLGLRHRAGLGHARDLEFTEAAGRLDGADPDRVSDRAITRGYDQCGTLGSGNHFLEVQVVDRDPRRGGRPRHGSARGADHRPDPLGLARARLPGLRRLPRGLQGRAEEVRLHAPRLAAGLRPGRSPEGQAYLGAMRAAANYRLVQPPVADPPGARGLRAGLWRALGDARDGPGLRRRAQHRQVRDPRRRSRACAKQVCVHRKGRPAPFRPAIPRSPRTTWRSASR